MPKTIADLRRHESVSEQAAVRMMLAVARIENQWGKYNQDIFGDRRSFDFEKHEVKCHSACCFAGHIVAMFLDPLQADWEMNGFSVEKEAHQLLGIPYDRDQIFPLFQLSECWPKRFKGEGRMVGPEHLRKRVEYYIETGETE